MATFRETLDPETIAWFERQSGSPDDWDWDEEIIETHAEPGGRHYRGADGLMVTEFDAAVEPRWRIEGDDGVTWESFAELDDAAEVRGQ